jgi:diacylglycerol kinase family enzyme
MKLTIIANPRSGANRRNPRRLDRIRELLGDRGTLLCPDGLDALTTTAEQLAEQDIEVLGICGGDGTIHQVMTALLAAYGEERPLPIIALLKAGTMNTIARNVGVRAGAEKLLARLLDGPPLPITERTLMITGEERAGFIFGNAGIAHFLEAYYDGGANPLTAAVLLIRAVASALVGGSFAAGLFRHCQMDLIVDGEPVSANQFTTLGVATVADLGFSFRPFYAAPTSPGRIQLIGIGCTPFRFATAIPTIRLARPIQRDDVIDHLGKTITLTFPEPLSYTIDGDLYPPCPSIVLRAGPQIRFAIY